MLAVGTQGLFTLVLTHLSFSGTVLACSTLARASLATPTMGRTANASSFTGSVEMAKDLCR